MTPSSPLPPGGVGGGHSGEARQATFSCVQSAYEIRHACLRRDWNKLKAETAWAAKNGATVEVKAYDNSVLIWVKRANSEGVDYISDLDPREASQITESLRECGATIKEAAKP